MDEAWPTITNKEAIAVNQAWAGESGLPFAESNDTVDIDKWTRGIPAWQYISKALGGGRVAVLLVNHRNSTAHLQFSFASVPGLGCSLCSVRAIWERKDLGPFSGGFGARVAAHGSSFLVVS